MPGRCALDMVSLSSIGMGETIACNGILSSKTRRLRAFYLFSKGQSIHAIDLASDTLALTFVAATELRGR